MLQYGSSDCDSIGEKRESVKEIYGMKNGKLIKNYIYNTLYQILVLITPLFTAPYISRVLGVTNIGIFQYSESIATYFVLAGAVGTTLYGQREIAYLQDKPKERSVAFWEIEIFRIIAVLVCTTVYVFTFCIQGEYSVMYTILIVEVVANAFDISWFFMGMENFKLTVIRNSIIKLTGVITVFLLVKQPSALGIYTACMTFPIFIGNVSLWFSLKRYLVKTELTFSTCFAGIKKRLRPIIILFLPQIAQEVYLVLDKTMIGIFGTSVDQVGYYAQSQKIVRVVLAIVTSLGLVMLPAMSTSFVRGDHDGIKKSIKTAFQFIYMLSFALLFGLVAIVSRFVPIFFGEGYDQVVGLMIIISPILVIIATSNVIGKQYLLPTNQQKAFTFSVLAGAGVNFILNVILITLWDAIGASIATVIAEITVTAVQCWCVRKQLPLKDCLTSGIRYAVYGALMYVTCVGVGRILPDGKIWAIAVIVITGVIVYLVELIVTKDPIIRMGMELVGTKE